ncbi:MAG: sodium:solute symporter [Acidobacteria bacterium]|nr:sodium:solute symporter [Acidobacteriota bacterium]MDP7339102.1 sodium:solute symporter family protein [Vicinamibacterales bacterium]HJN46150.1 sodium:solute symporter family protein [Vicinamibacterales bacterium]
MNLHLTVLLLYAGVLMTVGLWVSRRVRSTSDFFVAGRRLGPGLIFATLLAANLGAGTTVGAAGLGYRDGLSAWWWVGSAGLGSMVLAFWFGPRLRRLAAAHDLHTVGDFLEHRYGRQVRATIAILLWVGTLAILAGQLIAMGFVLNAVTGLDRWVGSVIGGVVVTVYFTAGGLLTSVWVNSVQLVVLVVGFTVVFPLLLGSVGGFSSMHDATGGIDGYWNFWRGGESGWFYLAMLGPSFIVSPGILQRVYGARDDRAVRLGVGLNGAALLVAGAVMALLGMMARTVVPELPDHDLALPTLFLESLPPLLGALGLAAVFSAEVSSADAILFMLSTSLSRDFYRRFVRPDASDRQVLRVARVAAVAGGVGGIIVAMWFDSIVDVLSFFYTLLTVSLFVPVLVGLYARRVRTPEALASIAAGVAVAAVVQTTAEDGAVVWLDPAMLGIGAALAAMLAAMMATRNKPVEVS